MKMKRRSTALLLALMMCLFLLSACGAKNTPDAEESPASVNTSAEQQPAEEKEEEPEEEPEQEEPEQEEPEEAEEPTQEEAEEINNAGTEFLALLQEEYENGFVEGEGPGRTYYCMSLGANRKAFVHDGVVYVTNGGSSYSYSYDIATKEFNEAVSVSLEDDATEAVAGMSPDEYHYYFIDGNFYFANIIFWGHGDSVDFRGTMMYDCNGAFLNEQYYGTIATPFDKGFLCFNWDGNSYTTHLWSYNLEKIAEIPIPEREIEHGLKEDMKLNPNSMFAADGTVYTEFNGDDSLYRLNTDTYEWEDTGDTPASINGHSFLGKYISCNDGIYNRVTGEQVFEYGELYHGACDSDDNLCFFGGDKYLGTNGSEYRWVNLTDLSMSDPLPFPEGKDVTILNDTYCVYRDKYGWFLWNYNDGTEETIMMFDN